MLEAVACGCTRVAGRSPKSMDDSRVVAGELLKVAGDH